MFDEATLERVLAKKGGVLDQLNSMRTDIKDMRTDMKDMRTDIKGNRTELDDIKGINTLLLNEAIASNNLSRKVGFVFEDLVQKRVSHIDGTNYSSSFEISNLVGLAQLFVRRNRASLESFS